MNLFVVVIRRREHTQHEAILTTTITWQHNHFPQISAANVQGPPNTFFFFGQCLKKTTEYFLKFHFFLFETTIG